MRSAALEASESSSGNEGFDAEMRSLDRARVPGAETHGNDGVAPRDTSDRLDKPNAGIHLRVAPGTRAQVTARFAVGRCRIGVTSLRHRSTAVRPPGLRGRDLWATRSDLWCPPRA